MKTNTRINNAVATLAILALCAALTNSARAAFSIDPNPGGVKLDLLVDARDAAATTGVVDTHFVNVEVVGNANFASGTSTIKPYDKNALTTIVFTPSDSVFGAFSFRGALKKEAGGTVTVIVNQRDGAHTFTFTGLGVNKDFDTIGIFSRDETIESVTIISDFKALKLVQFGYAK